MIMDKIAKIKKLSDFLDGVSVATKMSKDFDGAEKFSQASAWLRCLSQNICGQGFVGCQGGKNCTSSHK